MPEPIISVLLLSLAFYAHGKTVGISYEKLAWLLCYCFIAFLGRCFDSTLNTSQRLTRSELIQLFSIYLRSFTYTGLCDTSPGFTVHSLFHIHTITSLNRMSTCFTFLPLFSQLCLTLCKCSPKFITRYSGSYMLDPRVLMTTSYS